MNKHEMYLQAVQDPEGTVDWLDNEFRRRRRVKPTSFGEDFCGTFALSCAWVERGPERTAVAVDASRVPIDYGMRHYFSALKPDEQRRLKVLQSDVRHPRLPKVDVLCAFNFSYFVFKRRSELLQYFKNCRRRLNPNGMFFIDLFGGSEIQHRNVDVMRFKNFTYYWDQVSFNPETHEAKFYIHFKPHGKKRMARAFRYDWRVWTIPELRELLFDAGFERVFVNVDKLRKEAWVADVAALN